MQVIVVEPKKKPMVQDIGSDLESMQKIVGGSIEAIYPFEEPVALICNEEGKPLLLPSGKRCGMTREMSMISSPVRSFSALLHRTVTTSQG